MEGSREGRKGRQGEEMVKKAALDLHLVRGKGRRSELLFLRSDRHFKRAGFMGATRDGEINREWTRRDANRGDFDEDRKAALDLHLARGKGRRNELLFLRSVKRDRRAERAEYRFGAFVRGRMQNEK
jgi:hypothetical protein